ncbi:MAG: hypothetical protein OEN52_11735 [Gammaproteobacteria bacterium]|nr:hypothetical protein [Gammaproteobacteria bacterium]MDH3561611.1 hypothetical protein [Gammaproteobacteria bacterium]
MFRLFVSGFFLTGRDIIGKRGVKAGGLSLKAQGLVRYQLETPDSDGATRPVAIGPGCIW